jgi:hypothetical protein
VLGSRRIAVVVLGAAALGAAAVATFVTLDHHTEQYTADEQLDCGSLLHPEEVFYGMGIPIDPDGVGTAYGDGLSCEEQLEAAREVRQVAVIVAVLAAGLAVVVLTLPRRDPAEPSVDDPRLIEGSP